MARKKTNTPVTASSKIRDDFQLIKGIGPIVASRLHDAGIHTYSELASMSPAKLATRIVGPSTSQINRQDWIGQAQELASQKARTRVRKNEIMSPTRQHYENFTVEVLLDEKNVARRTRVVHVQSGDADTWAGWGPEQITDFLARHAELRIPQMKSDLHKAEEARRNISQKINDESTIIRPNDPIQEIPELSNMTKLVQPGSDAARTVPKKPTIAEHNNALRLCDLCVSLPSSDIPISFLRAGQPYHIRLTLDPSHVAAPRGGQFIYKATIIVKQVGGSCESISEESNVLSLSGNTTLRIVGSSLLPGIYRLDALVRLVTDENLPGITAALKGDLLQVY